MSTDLERPVMTLVAPHTGEVIDLAGPTEHLAEVLDSIKDLESRLREVKGELSAEVHSRMDYERKWTLRAGGYTLTGKSDAPEVVYDADRLAAVLTQFVDDGVIPPAAMDEAIEPVTGWKVKKAGINALRKNPKLAEAVDSCADSKPPENRRVSVKRA